MMGAVKRRSALLVVVGACGSSASRGREGGSSASRQRGGSFSGFLTRGPARAEVRAADISSFLISGHLSAYVLMVASDLWPLMARMCQASKPAWSRVVMAVHLMQWLVYRCERPAMSLRVDIILEMVFFPILPQKLYPWSVLKCVARRNTKLPQIVVVGVQHVDVFGKEEDRVGEGLVWSLKDACLGDFGAIFIVVVFVLFADLLVEVALCQLDPGQCQRFALVIWLRFS